MKSNMILAFVLVFASGLGLYFSLFQTSERKLLGARHLMPILVDPSSVKLGVLRDGESHEFELRLVNKGTTSRAIKHVIPTCTCIAIVRESIKDIPPLNELALRLIARPESGNSGALVQIAVDGQNIRVPVSWEISSTIVFSKKEIFLGEVQGQYSVAVGIKSTKGQDIKRMIVEAEPPSEISAVLNAAGDSINIEVTPQLPGRVRAFVSVYEVENGSRNCIAKLPVKWDFLKSGSEITWNLGEPKVTSDELEFELFVSGVQKEWLETLQFFVGDNALQVAEIVQRRKDEFRVTLTGGFGKHLPKAKEGCVRVYDGEREVEKITFAQ